MGKSDKDFKDRIQLRIDHNLNQEADWIFEQLGLTPSMAIRLFYQQVVIQKGLPFELQLKPHNLDLDVEQNDQDH